MARQPRFFAPDQPLHVIQRGNNRGAIFRDTSDYQLFLGYLAGAMRKHGVAVHAYVLMTNHWHLLATPLAPDSMPKALQSLGRRYVQRFNWTYERSGTLWEGRYRASIIDSDRYLLTCMRYIELNPVRAAMVRNPADHYWSSHHANAYGTPDALVKPHGLYESLAPTAFARQRAYRAMFDLPLCDAELASIREATNRNWALGPEPFQQNIEITTGRRAMPSRRGGRREASSIESDPIESNRV